MLKKIDSIETIEEFNLNFRELRNAIETIGVKGKKKYFEHLTSLKKRLKIGDNMGTEKKKLDYLFYLQRLVYSKNYI